MVIAGPPGVARASPAVLWPSRALPRSRSFRPRRRRLTYGPMQPLPRPSTASLSAARARPGQSRPVSFREALAEIWAWWTGRRPTYQERVREAQRIERLAAALAENDEAGA